jgi:hypothetical protein
LNLIICCIKEQSEEDTIEIVKQELKTKSQIETTYLIKEKRAGNCVKLSCTEHKYNIFSKSLSLKGSRIFINENLIPKEQVELSSKGKRSQERREMSNN